MESISMRRNGLRYIYLCRTIIYRDSHMYTSRPCVYTRSSHFFCNRVCSEHFRVRTSGPPRRDGIFLSDLFLPRCNNTTAAIRSADPMRRRHARRSSEKNDPTSRRPTQPTFFLYLSPFLSIHALPLSPLPPPSFPRLHAYARYTWGILIQSRAGA